MFGGAERGTATRHELTRSSEGQAFKTAKAESFFPPAWFLSSLNSFLASGICTCQIASSARLIRSSAATRQNLVATKVQMISLAKPGTTLKLPRTSSQPTTYAYQLQTYLAMFL
ncbi:MAG: hypothetical protein DMG64_20485, partial [Acidobacteria bacterium]